MWPARISAPRKLSKPCWTASSKRGQTRSIDTPLPARSLASQALHRQLQLQPSQDSLTVPKVAFLRLLDLGFLEKGTAVVLIEIPAWENLLSEDHRLVARLSGQPSRAVHKLAMDMLNHLLASRSITSLIRKLKLYTSQLFSSSMSSDIFLSTSRLQSVLSGHFHSSQPQEKYAHHHQHSLFRVGEYPPQSPPSRRPSPTAWSENSEIILLGGEAFAKPIRVRRRQPS